MLILTPGFAQNEADTTCLPLQQSLIKALNAAYPQLEIIILTFEYPYQKKTYHWHGLQVIAFGGQNKSRIRRFKNWLKVWQSLSTLCRQKHVTGLLSFWFDECALLGHYLGKRHSLKHYSWLMGQDARPGNRYFKWLRPQAGALIALSDFLAQETFKNYGVLPAYVIPAGINPAIFNKCPVQRDIDILGVGSLIPLKQFELFIEAVKFVKEFIPMVHTVICGHGPEYERLNKLIKYHHLEENITLTGQLPYHEVLALMQRSKVLLHPSNYEGFAGVLLEGLYAGAQVVSFVKPMDAAIKHHYVVNDATAMYHQVLDLLQMPALDHTRVLPYSINSVAAAIMKLYDYNEVAIS